MLDISQPSSSEGFSGDGDGFLMLESRILLALDPKRKNSCDYKLYGYLRTIIFVAIITQCWIVSFFLSSVKMDTWLKFAYTKD